MKHFKMRTMQSKSPTVYTKSLSRDYGVDLSAPSRLYKIGIHGVSQVTLQSNEPAKLSHLGDPTGDGRYEIFTHCHGENLLGGEELAAAILEAASTNSYVTASVEDGILSFSSRTNRALLPTGRLRGASQEVFTIVCKFSAPENTGTMISTGLAFMFSQGTQTISYNKTYNGETVQIQTNSNATRQVLNLSLATTSGKPRTIILSDFGIFRGTASSTSFSPYWGEKKSFFLSEPLRSLSNATDVAYPIQGYAIRNVRATPFTPTSIETVSLGSAYPTYRLPLPEALWTKELLLDRFTLAKSESELLTNALLYMRASDGKSLLISASESHSTPTAFLNYFNSLSVQIEYAASDPVIERFAPITFATRAGRNYIDLMTATEPGTIEFTYA